MADSVTSLSAGSEVQGGDQANTGALSGYVGPAEVNETSFQKGENQANTGGLSGYVGSAEEEENWDALPTVAVNQRNKNMCVWLRAPRKLVLDELLPAALSARHAATELMPQSAATAGDFAAFSASSRDRAYAAFCRAWCGAARYRFRPCAAARCLHRARWRSPPCVARALDQVRAILGQGGSVMGMGPHRGG